MSAAGNDEFLGEIVIRGVTKAGRIFRPSDWAERLASVASRVGSDNRLNYSPRVRPVTRDGVRCVVIDRALELQEARLYRFLLDFARQNDLMISEGRQSARD
jgi:hypothetical protein